MELEDDPDISLSVPLKPLYEEYCCPICFNTISDGYITPCGFLKRYFIFLGNFIHFYIQVIIFVELV